MGVGVQEGGGVSEPKSPLTKNGPKPSSPSALTTMARAIAKAAVHWTRAMHSLGLSPRSAPSPHSGE